MGLDKWKAVDWSLVALSFPSLYQGSRWACAMKTLSAARNRMRKLTVKKKKYQAMPEAVRPYVRTHCTLPEIQFASRIHPMRPTTAEEIFRHNCKIQIGARS